MCPPGRTISGEESRTPDFADLPLLLKFPEIVKFVSPFVLSLLSPWCSSLHTRVNALRCGWSALDMPPSDWWRTPCMCWCVYPAGELSVSCVHIAVYIAHRFFRRLAPTCHVRFLLIIPKKKHISTNRPI